MTHCRSGSLNSSSACAFGSAMFITVPSSATMVCARATVARMRLRRGCFAGASVLMYGAPWVCVATQFQSGDWCSVLWYMRNGDMPSVFTSASTPLLQCHPLPDRGSAVASTLFTSGNCTSNTPPPCTMEPGLRNFINCQRIAQKTERSKRAISPAQFMNGRSNRHDRASEGG
jgi:hypothetical protein